MTSCYSLLEQYITGSDLSFELMLNELCLLLSLSLSDTELSSLIKKNQEDLMTHLNTLKKYVEYCLICT